MNTMIAYFDMVSGISGDMTLGAFVDLGVPAGWIENEIKRMPLSGFTLEVRPEKRNAICARNLSVTSHGTQSPRDYRKIRSLIENAPLSERVKQKSLTAFHKIAAAEARIHSQEIGDVHFHEVGGVDAIVDIVGTFLCMEYLEIDRVFASSVPLGSGSVRCSHGMLPVPVPAVLDILKGMPVKAHEAGGEIVTPTGAAILAAIDPSFSGMPDMVMGKTGYGWGKRDTGSDIPNLLRIITGNSRETHVPGETSAVRDEVCVVTCAVDDMNHEWTGYLMKRLFRAGAMDVCHIPVQMKKNRPGIKIEVICPVELVEKISEIILTESTSTGIRYCKAQRIKLKREQVTEKTAFGKVEMKKITGLDGTVSIVPEFEACRKIAEEKGIPLKKVYEQLHLDIRRP